MPERRQNGGMQWTRGAQPVRATVGRPKASRAMRRFLRARVSAGQTIALIVAIALVAALIFCASRSVKQSRARERVQQRMQQYGGNTSPDEPD